jgi:hypothetical protein
LQLFLVVPCVGDTANLCETVELFRCVVLGIIGLALFRRYEDVDADLALLLVTVGGKPAQIRIFINDLKVVIGF